MYEFRNAGHINSPVEVRNFAKPSGSLVGLLAKIDTAANLVPFQHRLKSQKILGKAFGMNEMERTLDCMADLPQEPVIVPDLNRPLPLQGPQGWNC